MEARPAEETSSGEGALLESKLVSAGRRSSAVRLAIDVPPTNTKMAKASSRNFQVAVITISCFPQHQQKVPRQDDVSARIGHEHAAAFDPQQGQIAGCIGARVDVDTVFPDVRLSNRGVTVNNKLAKVHLTIEKFIANPE